MIEDLKEILDTPMNKLSPKIRGPVIVALVISFLAMAKLGFMIGAFIL